MPYVNVKARIVRKRRPRGKRKNLPKKATTVAKLSRQVAKLSNSIKKDVEVKQYYPANVLAGTVGQVDVNATGAFAVDLGIMNLAEGVSIDDRVGVKCKLIGTSIRAQIQQQSACDFYNKYIVDIVGTMDMNASATTILNRIYNPDSISQVIDANSTRDYNQLKSKTNPMCDTFLIASKRVTVSKDATTATQLGFKDFKMFIKQSVQLLWAGGAINPPNNFRMLMFIRAQAGNKSTATASTLPQVPATAINTGGVIRFSFTNYYTDL